MNSLSTVEELEAIILEFIIEHPGVELFGDDYNFLNPMFKPITGNLWVAFDNLIARGAIRKVNEDYEEITIEWFKDSPLEILRQANVYPTFTAVWLHF